MNPRAQGPGDAVSTHSVGCWRLTPALKRYDWGDGTYLSRLLRLEADGGRIAEAWFGAHPVGPAHAQMEPVGGFAPLDDFVRQASEDVMGYDVSRRFDGLPYLLKILAAERPLSIQVHPTSGQARVGFDREEELGVALGAPQRVFKDPRHKPELLVALGDFYALCGFRPYSELRRVLAGLPEVAGLVAPPEPSPDGLRRFLRSWFALAPEQVEPSLARLLERLQTESDAKEPDPMDPAYWCLCAHRTSGRRTPDRGLIFVFLLVLVRLKRGEGMFMEAGVPHAYLHGAGVEVMANSDNVLRAGLTSKPVQLDALLDVIRCEPLKPRVLEAPTALGEAYATPAPEFSLGRTRLETGDLAVAQARGPVTVLPLEVGHAGPCLEVRVDGTSLELKEGQAALIAHGVTFELRALAPVTVFQASVGDQASIYLSAIERNIEWAKRVARPGLGPALVGTVSGSVEAQEFWQRELEQARPSLGAETIASLHEDLPVNQAFGLLLMWQRIRDQVRPGEGALMAFVFGEGSRSTPFTEAESGQKPAILSCSRDADGRQLSIVELALRTFLPVEVFLRRSGFDGVVVKWGDEVQIPTCDLAEPNPRFAGADVVRFVSMVAMDEDSAANKDWVGVDPTGRVTAFIPRRPLQEMEQLADRGLFERRQGQLWGGINLGSVGLSRLFLEALLEEFQTEVADSSADRKDRPDLDPQFFTALTIAARSNRAERDEAWQTALSESAAMRRFADAMPNALERLGDVLTRFEKRNGRPVKMMALDFQDQYWGDIGQHPRIYDFYLSLRDRGPKGRIARALAGIEESFDDRGNILVGRVELGPDVDVRGSVLVDVEISSGTIVDSVLVGTRARRVDAEAAFDVLSTVNELYLPSRSGTYRVISEGALHAAPRERLTTVVLPEGPTLLRVFEDTELGNKPQTYDIPIHDNVISFREAHQKAIAADPVTMRLHREVLADAALESVKKK